MTPFRSLVRRVRREATTSRKRPAGFADLAVRLLTDFEYDWSRERLDRELARWLSADRILPDQVALHNTFGQPPLTLFNDERVVLDLYLWVAADTSLHSHGFRGAFRVLHGRSLEETYSPRVIRRIAPGVMQVDPGTPEATLLGPGDVRAILPGDRRCHRVVHLERPTVILCLKTINEPLQQWEYFPDGLAVQRRDLVPAVVKKLYYYDYLLRQDPGRAERFIRDVVDSLSVVMRMILQESLSDGSLDLSEQAVEGCRKAIRRRQGKAGWFRRHVALETSPPKDLQVAGCDSALGRLVGHGLNENRDPGTILSLGSRLVGRDLTRRDVEAVLRSPSWLAPFDPR
jgi:hypothetical protein